MMSMNNFKGFYGVNEIMELMACSKGQAYKYIRDLNNELKEKGYLIRAGYIPKNYFHERYYAEY